MANNLQDCLRLLELGPGANLEDVKRAYRELVKVWHPDRFTGDAVLQEKAQERIKRINAAYETLTVYLTMGQQNSPIEGPEVPHTTQNTTTGPELYRIALSKYHARDLSGAFQFFMQAAQMDDADAQYAVGFIYRQHQTRHLFTLTTQVRNDREAFTWWTRAAERGNANAQYMLGISYLYAQGTTYHEGEARKWFERAASKGHKQAKERLKTMNSLSGVTDKIRAVPLVKWVMEPAPAPPPPT
jgi:TPR repeat protein